MLIVILIGLISPLHLQKEFVIKISQALVLKLLENHT